ncbi:hypothetical protein BASA81_007952 [Batrachochytrium salamandrivorans]|nr:hypothetical protein BASA81_007952 [Batrachochytrium salamandrivorans]
MLIQISPEGQAAGLDYSQCLCGYNSSQSFLNATGFPYDPNNPANPEFPTLYPSEQVFFNRYQTVLAITGVGGSTGQNCFICQSKSSAQVFEPCPTYGECTTPGMNGFRPATGQINSSQVCNTLPSYNPLNPVFADLLIAPAITDRAQVNTLILAMSCLFLIQMLAAMVIAFAYFKFKDKYGADWQKLSRGERVLGVLAKLLPAVARLANLVSLIILAMASSYFFGSEVCRYDLDSVGQASFYPAMFGYLIAMIVVWLFFCVVGGVFHMATPRDTSFYNPKFPDEPGENCCKRVTCKTCTCLTTFGP